MAKTILFNAVEYAMLQELAKRQRLKPEEYLKKIIYEYYNKVRI